MAINIWRCHIVADTPTSPLNEPAYYSDNSENSLKYEHLVTEYAILTTSILISVSCPKIVQWDAINYNQAPLENPKRVYTEGGACYAYYVAFDAIL